MAFVARAEEAWIAELDLAVVSGPQMASLNRRWLGRGGATDVISFDLSDDPAAGPGGQIIVCADVAVREARRRGVGPQRELMLYVVHGLLHLIGYDDASPRAAARMHAREEEILETFLTGQRDE